MVDTIDVEDPLAWVEDFQARYFLDDYEGLPRCVGGLVGYFGYETIAYIEKKLDGAAKEDPLGTPDIALLVSNEVIVFDNLLGKLMIVVHVEAGEEVSHMGANDRERVLFRPEECYCRTVRIIFRVHHRRKPVCEDDHVQDN